MAAAIRARNVRQNSRNSSFGARQIYEDQNQCSRSESVESLGFLKQEPTDLHGEVRSYLGGADYRPIQLSCGLSRSLRCLLVDRLYSIQLSNREPMNKWVVVCYRVRSSRDGSRRPPWARGG